MTSRARRSVFWLVVTGFAAATVAAAAGAATPAPAPAIAAAEPPRPRRAAAPKAILRYVGLSAPESVLYDASGDRYLVANVNGGATAEDNNGFISVLSPDGQVTALKWIEGGKRGVKLNAPKGLAIARGLLFVADISVVRTFDARTGAPRATIAVPGSTFLNGLAAAPDGKVYVSDAGPPTGNWQGVGTEAVYVLERGRARPFARGETLGRPTGVAWTDQGLVVGPFGSDEVYRLDRQGHKQDVTKLPAGGIAGIVPVGDGLLVTSWQASSVFRGKLGGAFQVALAEQRAPGDPGYDTRRARLLVPHFTEDNVEVYAVP
jgi:DNA-binding beta-propeller fold protein YncE